MWRFLVGVVLGCLWACNPVFGIPESEQGNRIGGRVRGLWNGTSGVVLRLQAESIDSLFTIAADGTFDFDTRLTHGVAYTVSVAASPDRHMCTIDSGGAGMATESDITSVSVACQGPAVSIVLPGVTGWSFAPLDETQRITGSVAMQEVAFVIGGDVSGASVDDVPVTIGQGSVPIGLPLGPKTMQVALTSGALSKIYQFTLDRGASVLEQIAYGKASNTATGDLLSMSIALNGDTLAVGAIGEDGAATGINGNQADNSAPSSGAVYVFVRSGATWTQQAYIKASNTGNSDQFGYSVSLSENTLAVGANYEDSAATGINGSQTNNSATDSGAVYIFVRNGSNWTQQAYLKASNTGLSDLFGTAVSVDGDTAAVSALCESSAAIGVNGNQADNSAPCSGAVYIFVRNGSTWSQQAYFKASNTGASDYFGYSVSLSGDTLAVGANGEDSAATGANSNQADNSAADAGAVYVFVRSGAAWTQQAYLKASNTGTSDQFGYSVSLDSDTLAVGAQREDSATSGVDGNQADNGANDAGAAYVFVRSGTTWTQQAYIKASNTGAPDLFGSSIAVAGDILAIGADNEGSSATGINGSQADNSSGGAGAVYLFYRNGTSWTQRAYVKASNTGASDYFGYSVALSRDTLAVGAYNESSSATGINGNQADNSASQSGAIYLFH